MKRYNLAGTDYRIIAPLCKYFRLDIRDITYVQRVEMVYIYERLAERLPDTDMRHIIAEIDRLRLFLKVRGKRRSLYYVFYWCQSEHMKKHGEYDTAASRPPVIPIIGDYY